MYSVQLTPFGQQLVAGIVGIPSRTQLSAPPPFPVSYAVELMSADSLPCGKGQPLRQMVNGHANALRRIVTDHAPIETALSKFFAGSSLLDDETYFRSIVDQMITGGMEIGLPDPALDWLDRFDLQLARVRGKLHCLDLLDCANKMLAHPPGSRTGKWRLLSLFEANNDTTLHAMDKLCRAEPQAAAGILREKFGVRGTERPLLRDAWRGHYFHPWFMPYKPGKHVDLPPGSQGAILSSNEHPHGPPARAVEEMLLLGKFHPSITEETVGGMREMSRLYIDDYTKLKERLAEFLGHGIEASQIYAAAGASQLIYKLIRAVNPEQGPIMGFMPGFFMYPIGAMAEGQQFHAVPLNDDFSYPLERFLEEARDINPPLIFIDTPNNPMGGVVPPDWLKTLIAERARNNGYVVVDEAYFDFNDGDGFTALELLDKFPNVIVLRSFSKNFGLAGARLGLGVAAKGSAAETLFTRITTPFEISTATVELAQRILQHKVLLKVKADIEEVIRSRERLHDELGKIRGVRPVIASKGNFILIDVKGTGMTAGQFCDALAAMDFYVRPMPPNPIFIPRPIAEKYELLRVTVGSPGQCNALLRAMREITGTA